MHRYLDTTLKNGDRIDFNVEEGVGGTFEVDAIPDNDAVLLLVLERRDASSSLVAFQSFAFPKNKLDTAQVAIIDTLKSEAKAPQETVTLNMQDHVQVDPSGKPTISQRVRLEELGMNRVYAVQAGDYDTDIQRVGGNQTQHVAMRNVHLRAGQDYVFLRTGTNDPSGQDLVVFPGDGAAALSALFAGLVCLLAW
jgi:hypothetical protein